MDLSHASLIARMHLKENASPAYRIYPPQAWMRKGRCVVKSWLGGELITLHREAARRRGKSCRSPHNLATRSTCDYTREGPYFPLSCWSELSNESLTDVAASVWLYLGYVLDVKAWAALHLG
jgi:hypothetical protein